MKSLRSFLSDARRHKGLALIIVLSMLALATIVMLAFLSVADTEHKGTMSYSSSQTARRLADTAVNVVIAQIRAGSDQDIATAGREIHATQPGTVRKYTHDGSFLAGYKLFSDSELIFKGTGVPNGPASVVEEYNFVKKSEPEADWNKDNNTVRYVDLNEPVIKGIASANGTVAGSQVYFPIIDPRAAYDMEPGPAQIPMEGFHYARTTALSGNNIGSADNSGALPIQLPPADIDALRLAMPVKWMYMLKDGSLGTLAQDLTFQGPAGIVPSVQNPIVARLAFWTDDETCKININTASEPTYQGRPTYYHERDHRWADYPAARGEYQRFSGHPATVALSSVLYPNPFQQSDRDMDTFNKTAGGAALKKVMSVKNRIYDLVPRLHVGGSEGGTKLFAADTYNAGGAGGLTTNVNLTTALTERLYASMDELIFSGTGGGLVRTRNNTAIDGGNLFTKQTLERASAFLSAHSRGSEISMLGLPRIAMWPISTSVSNRTGFDQLIAFCSRLGPVSSGNLYLFQRGGVIGSGSSAQLASQDAFYDINSIPRNKALLDMMDKILANARFPGETAAGNAGNTFMSKMGAANGFQNYRQVIVQMFDYIRCTNLYDSFIAPPRNSWTTYVGNVDWTQTYARRDQVLGDTKTYTVGIARNPGNSTNPFTDRALPGHGQVTPAVWNVGGQNYRGFGRAVSISEIGLQFICTADGQPDMYSWRNLEFEGAEEGVKKYKIPQIGLVETGLVDSSGQPIAPQYSMAELETGANAGTISGGRTALRLRDTNGQYIVDHAPPTGFNGDFRITNAAGQHWSDLGTPNEIKRRYYSNYPPNPAAGSYGTEAGPETDANRGFHVNNHPGFRPENWNYTLENGEPLEINQKRVQAMLHLEFFCPSVGYTTIFPEFTVVLRGQNLPSIEAETVNGLTSIFSSTSDVVLKSSTSIYEIDSTPQVGGYSSFRRLARGRLLPARAPLPQDVGYDSSATGNVHGGLVNMDLVSSFFTVNSDQEMKFQSAGAPLRIDIYDTHDYQRQAPIQTIFFRIPPGRAPTPDLVVQPTHLEFWVRPSDGVELEHPSVPAPHWWAFHRGGAIGRDNGPSPIVGRLAETTGGTFGRRLNRDGDTAATDEEGRSEDSRQRFPGTTALIYGFDNTNNYRHALRHDNTGSPNVVRTSRIAYKNDVRGNPYNRLAKHVGSDVVRSLQPGHGDARIIFAKAVVQADEWSPHPLWDSETAFMAHNFSSYNAGSEVGFDRSGDPQLQIQGIENPTKRSLPQSINVPTNLTPDAPYSGLNGSAVNSVTGSLSPAFLCQRYYDFDEPDPGGRVGTFINKPDEGNFSVGEFKASNWPSAVDWRSSYFRANSFTAQFAPGSQSFFTPNRMISSAVMMGSLPSRIHFANKVGLDPATGGNGAWTNLLFRPHIQMTGGAARHPGMASPPDHYLLDLFWMPVVEPYAISEPLSTAGKVNMNYQMVPFTHIRRATALHAVMKGELFAALPNVDYDRARSLRTGFGLNGSTAPVFRNEGQQGTDAAAKWHRSIVVDRLNNPSGGADNPWWTVQAGTQRIVGTLRQFEERFNFGAGDVSQGPAGVGGGSANDGLPASFRSGLFRSATQICETHLIPSRISLTGNRRNVNTGSGAYAGVVQGADKESNENIAAGALDSYADREAAMKTFWNNHAATGDNTRESPYANLYAKLTTRSNTFRVHVRAQTVKKALRGTDITRFIPGEDEVTGEFRGSFLLERYIDTADLQAAGTKADFTQGNPMDETAHPPLDSYYRFRIIESKRFAP